MKDELIKIANKLVKYEKEAESNSGAYNFDKVLELTKNLSLEDMLEIAYKFDFIHRVNNITYELVNLETGEIYVDPETGKELTGKRKDLEEYIKNNIEFQTHYIAMLNKYISASDDSYGNVLDAREQQEIKAQEDSVEAYLQKAIPLENK